MLLTPLIKVSDPTHLTKWIQFFDSQGYRHLEVHITETGHLVLSGHLYDVLKPKKRTKPYAKP